MNLQTGAFGDPTNTATLILFWTKMEELHYPGANSTKDFLEKRLKQEQEQAALQARQAQTLQAQIRQGQGGLAQGGGISAEMAQAIDERARQDAMAAAGQQQGGIMG